MELTTSNIMMLTFILVFTLSIWKIYAFLPNTELADDDTRQESQDELLEIIKKHWTKDITSKELLKLIQDDVTFDKEHFWRFNENKLNQILSKIET